jgi:hypothetical protein
MEAFFATLAFAGAVSGFAGGALAAWRGWRFAPAFGGTAAVYATFVVLHGLPHGLDLGASVASIILAPLVATLPLGAGFAIGSQMLGRR